MTIDADLVTRKTLLITSDIDRLRPLFEKGLDAYLQNPIDQAVVERYLERAIGRMIDINYHLITETGHPPPSDSRLVFEALGAALRDVPAYLARLHEHVARKPDPSAH